MQYKLIVSDFDGTLRRSKGGISEGNARAIKEYGEAGGVFALCTGRMISSILPYAKQLNLQGFVVAYQGAIIQDIATGKNLRDARIPNKDAVSICRFLESRKEHIHVYDGDIFYVNMDDNFRLWYEQACAVRGILTPLQISETVEKENICPHKILVACTADRRGEIYSALSERYGEQFYVTTSTENLVEITVKGCNKGDALRYIADSLKIPMNETIAIGDNYNDLPMVQAAGLGVAVMNGEKALKKAAGFVTKNCDEDGVGYVIRKFGLGENI